MTNSKQKGSRGERELSHKLTDLGYQCRRTVQYCGNTGDASDVVGLDGIHIECKRNEHLNVYDAMAQSKHDAKEGLLPTVMWRKNNCEWLVTMRLEDWIEIYREWECGQHDR